jgi:hypothetical protein
MANEVLTTIGSPTTLCLADATDFDNDPIPDTDQIDLTSLANAAARQSAKFDFGAKWAGKYSVMCSFEIDVAPASGAVVDVYIAPSIEATAGDSNPGGVSGADAAYTGTAGDSIADSLKQLDFIGSVICTADADPVMQTQSFVYAPHCRYASLVVFNQSGQAFVGDATHHFIIFTPIVPEIQ